MTHTVYDDYDDCVNYNNCYCNVVVVAAVAAAEDDDGDDDDDDNNERGIPLYTLTVCNQNSVQRLLLIFIIEYIYLSHFYCVYSRSDFYTNIRIWMDG